MKVMKYTNKQRKNTLATDAILSRYMNLFGRVRYISASNYITECSPAPSSKTIQKKKQMDKKDRQKDMI